jgi:Spx/MgsR family transcriptional regulator
MLQIIGIKNCNTMKKTFDWLDSEGHKYDFRDVKKDPLTREELASVAGRVSLDVLINRRGMKWRTLGLANKDHSDDELFEILLVNQTMMKRPVVECGDAVMVGFEESALDSFIKEYSDEN